MKQNNQSKKKGCGSRHPGDGRREKAPARTMGIDVSGGYTYWTLVEWKSGKGNVVSSGRKKSPIAKLTDAGTKTP